MAHSALAPILVVEDNVRVCQFMVQVLSELDREVRFSGTFADAMAQLESPQPIGMLISDLVLPDGSGAALARKATELRPGLKILLMSGYDIAGLGYESVMKPFDAEELLTKVRTLFEE